MKAKSPENSPARGLKPLLGFGWMGWALLPVAAALIVVLVTGYDLRYQLLALIERTFGEGSAIWFTAWVHSTHYINVAYWPPSMQFGLITMCIVLVAFKIYPDRIRWWWWVLVCVVGVTAPPLSVWSMYWMQPLTVTSIWQQGVRMALSTSLVESVVVVVLWRATRSWFVLASMLGLFAVGRGSDWSMSYYELWSASVAWPTMLYSYAAQGWYLAFAATLLIWSIRARVSFREDWQCQSCGYDLRTLSVGVCSECGAAVENDGAS